VPVSVTLGPPIDLTGASAATATRLVPGDPAFRSLVGTTDGVADYFVVTLQAGTRYGVDVNVEAGAAPLVEVLGTDATTVLASHQYFQTLESGQVLNHYTMAVTPAAAGDYYVRITGVGADNPSFYTLRVDADPLADVTSSIEAFSSIASQTGGAFDVRDDVKSSNGGNTAAYVAALYNIMSSTLGPTAIFASPGTAPEGQTLSISLTGRKTNWRQGATSVSFAGGGIAVLSVTVTSPTTLSALVQVATDAAQSFRDVTVTSQLGTATETAAGSQVLQITAPITAPTLLSVEPNTMSLGQTADIVVRGAMTSWDSTSTISLGPEMTVNSFVVVSPTLIDANVSVAADAAIGFRTATVTTGTTTVQESRAVFVNIGALVIPQITAVSPATGNIGQTLDVAITGANTNFLAGVTTVSFGAGITVDSVTVSGPTQASAHIVVALVANPGFRDVVVTTGSEMAASLQAFFVSPTTVTTPVFSPPESMTVVYGTPSIVLSGHLASGTTIPTGVVAIQLGQASVLAAIDPNTGDFSTTLSTTALGASASPYTVTYSYAASANFNAASATSSLTVRKADPTIAWADPAAIVYGTPLGPVQLDAAVSLPGPDQTSGALNYSVPAGTILHAGSGEQLTVTVAVTANYNAATRSVFINILKATPSVTWAGLADIRYGTTLGPGQLSAQASVPGAFAYTPGQGIALAPGRNEVLSATFTPSDAADYNSVTVITPITVNAAPVVQGRVALVTVLYRRLLGRDPEPAGLRYWVKELDIGVSPWSVSQAFVASREHRAQLRQHRGTGISRAAALRAALRADRHAILDATRFRKFSALHESGAVDEPLGM
jgi:hypothetical protein